jgi:hypothetical protein
MRLDLLSWTGNGPAGQVGVAADPAPPQMWLRGF